jgi:AraC-like DNA-binding protein
MADGLESQKTIAAEDGMSRDALARWFKMHFNCTCYKTLCGASQVALGKVIREWKTLKAMEWNNEPRRPRP